MSDLDSEGARKPGPALSGGDQPLDSAGGVLAPVGRASGAIVRATRVTAAAGVGAALALLAVIVSWVWPLGPLGWGVGGAFGLLLLVPSLVVLLFGSALAQLVNLPRDLSLKLSDSVTASRGTIPAQPMAGRSAVVTVASWARYLFGLRTGVWAMREELATAGALLRLFNGPVLIGVLVAAITIGLLVPVAGLAVLVALLVG